ncbi:MAG: class I SAM-dependent methyltransferase [Gemmataceae bacterium]|nr:class I SAM-dependent methyltransferase [Gemmataceae bacterium]
MNLRKYVPRSAKRRYRAVRNFMRSYVLPPQGCRAELYGYWKEPFDGENSPEGFLDPFYTRRTEYLIKIVQEKVAADASILEVGCGIGRNLKALHSKGYMNLSGIDISENAVRLLRACSPDLAATTTLYNGPVEKVVRTLPDRRYDFVFTMEALAHLHRESEGAFLEIARVANRYLFAFEDEETLSWRNFPRNYQKVFERLGWKQVHKDVGEETIGLGGGYVARLFVRN